MFVLLPVRLIGGSKQVVHTQIVQDPALVEQLRQYQEQNQQTMIQYRALVEEMERKKLTTMDQLAAHDREKFEALVSLAQKTEPIQMHGNNFAFFGLTSSGKSTMINSIVGADVAETGAGETTLKPSCYSGTGFVVWDMPGKNDDLSYFSMEYIGFWKGLSRRLIVITSTVKEMSHVCRILDKLALDYDIVANKFDAIESEQERTKFKKQIYDEIKQLQLKYVRSDRVFFLSAKRPNRFPDWLDMVNYLLTPSISQNDQPNQPISKNTCDVSISIYGKLHSIRHDYFLIEFLFRM